MSPHLLHKCHDLSDGLIDLLRGHVPGVGGRRLPDRAQGRAQHSVLRHRDPRVAQVVLGRQGGPVGLGRPLRKGLENEGE